MSSPKPHISSPTSIARIPHPIANFHRQNSTSHRQLPSPEFHISSPNYIAKIPHLISIAEQDVTSPTYIAEHFSSSPTCDVVISKLRYHHPQTGLLPSTEHYSHMLTTVVSCRNMLVDKKLNFTPAFTSTLDAQTICFFRTFLGRNLAQKKPSDIQAQQLPCRLFCRKHPQVFFSAFNVV